MRSSYKVMMAMIYAVTLFLDRLDLTIVNITLPTVARHFNVSIVDTDWVSLSFLLALAVSIPISNWLGERFGLKRVYIFSILLFGLGSTLCVFARDLPTLVALRFIHGIGGGMLIPVGMTMLYRVYEKSEYAGITSFTFVPSLIAPAIAPFLGGILLEHLGWQFVFVFSGPICLMLAGVAAFQLRELPRRALPPLDILGFMLSAGALLVAFYLLSVVAKPGHGTLVALSGVGLALLIAAFILHEMRCKAPLIDLRCFRQPIFVRANLLQLCFQCCHFGAIFIIGMFLQLGVGLSASLAGLLMGMQAIGAMISNRYSVRLFNTYGARVPVTCGLAGIAALSPAILWLGNKSVVAVGAVFLLRGCFSGLCGTPIQTLSVIGFQKEDLGAVNTVFNALRQVSISCGVALSSLLVEVGSRYAGAPDVATLTPQQVMPVFAPGFVAIVACALLGIAIARGVNRHSG